VEKTVNAERARREFGKLLDAVANCRERIIIERRGEPAAVLVPVHVYQQWEQRAAEARREYNAIMDRAAANANLSEEEAAELAAEAVAWARGELVKDEAAGVA
jgi:prevent-host-death family protein